MEAVVANSVSRSRRQVALVFLLAATLLTTGIVTDPARAGATVPPRGEMFNLTNADREAKHRHDLDPRFRKGREARPLDRDEARLSLPLPALRRRQAFSRLPEDRQ